MVRRACGLLRVLGVAAWLPTVASAMDFTLAENGKPKCQIVLPPASSEITQHAASRLQSAIAEASGVTLPVRSESEPTSADTCRILLGTLAENRTTASFLRDKRLVVSLAEREQEEYKQVLVPENLGPEGFVILPGEYQGRSTLALTGGTPVAALYAVETLLDRVFVQGGRVLAGPLVSEVTPVVNTPAFPVRSIATNLGGPDWVAGGQWEQEWPGQGGYDWRGFIDWMASHKLNNLDAWIFDLAFGIAYDSNRFPEVVNRLHPNVKHEFMKDLIDYAHSRGIKVFVMIDFPDNWTAVVKAHPELAGKNFNPKDIPSGKEWEEYQKYGEARLNQAGGQRFRTRFSWVCMSEPKTLQFWRDYIDDLLAHYPALDGVGLQVSETARNRCNCEKCTRDPLAQFEKYFAEMVDVGRRKNPKLKFWIYNSWGTRDIEAHQARYPNFVAIDWSLATLGPLYYKQYIPRGNWYLMHTMGQRFSEFTYKYAAMALNESGQEGMQIRAAAYKTQENSFQAFEEFAWNPRLGIEQFADLFVKKVYHHADQQVSELYSAWMKLLGYRSLTGQSAGGPGGPPPPGAGGSPGAGRGPAGPGGPSPGGVYYENPNRDADLARADEAKATVVRLLGQVQDRSELVSAIRAAFERLNSPPGTSPGFVRSPDKK